MEFADFIKSGIGAALGFALAQLINLAKLVWDWVVRPQLEIEAPNSNCLILSHMTEVGNGEVYSEKIYGFYVRNGGRRIATGVKIQLVKIEYRSKSWLEFAEASEHVYDLALYKGAARSSEGTQAVLIPGTAVLIGLASWREDYDVIFPAISGLPDYYAEICSGAHEYRFTVVAFDDKAQFVTSTLTLQYGE